MPIFPPNVNHLLQLCCKAKLLHQGKQVHKLVISLGLAHEPFFATKLVQLYADCDNVDVAQSLFDDLSSPNVFAWTAFLAFYSRHGFNQKCVEIYTKMKSKSVLPDPYVFPKVLRACSQLLCFEAGAQIHKDVIVYGSEFNLQVCNSLIDMYAKFGNVDKARSIFDEMAERDLFSWNTMISGYVCNNLFELAVELYGLMEKDGFEPDIVTWNTVIDSYCRMGQCDEAWNIFRQIDMPNIISWTTLISGYSRIGKHEKSLKIFGEMVNEGKVFPDTDSLSSVLVSCRNLSALSSGKEIHCYGIKMVKGTAFYRSAGAALLALYAKCCRIQDARTMFELMDKSDVVTWNAMILAFVDLGLGHMAIECFSQLQKQGIQNDQTTISTILPVCDLKYGKQIHAYISKSSLYHAIPVLNALVHMYSKCGYIKSAHLIFSNMIARDLVTWNTMIGGFAMHGHGQAALQLLDKMIHTGLSPTSTTITSVLSACAHSGLVDNGLQLFYSMTKEFGLTPTMEHFACVSDMLARAGKLEDAVRFIGTMPLEPDRRIWGSLLAACQEHQNLNIGKLASEKIANMEPDHVGHRVTLSNIYARAGKWDDSVQVRKQIETRGLVKPTGQSWIQVEADSTRSFSFS